MNKPQLRSAGRGGEWGGDSPTYVVLGQVGVVSLDAVIQDGDHHVPAGVAPLPRRHHVHPGATAAVPVAAVTGTTLTDGQIGTKGCFLSVFKVNIKV